MKAFAHGFYFVIAGYFLAANFSLANAADTNSLPRLTVDLRDGSRVVGNSVEKNFRFYSALLGEIKLDVKDIRSVECVSSNSAKLSTVSGDSLTVSFVDSEFALKTSFGQIKLAVNSIREITMTAMNAAGAHPPGLMALWSAEGNALDTANARNNGAMTGGATFADGKIGQAFSFNGDGQYVKIPQSARLNLSNQATIMFWMKSNSNNSMNSFQGLVTGDFCGVEIANGITFYLSDDQGASWACTRPGLFVTPNRWHHIAGTYDGTKLQLYVDGWPCGSPLPHSGTISPMLANSFLAIGSEDGRTCCDCIGNRYFNGLLDEISIYDRALSAGEIKAICTKENHGEPLPPPPYNSQRPFNGIYRSGFGE